MPLPDLPLHQLFAPVTKDQWTQQVLTDFKGRPLDHLVGQTPDGFLIDPFYTAEDLASLPLADIQAAQRTKRTPGWLNTPEVHPASTTAPADLTCWLEQGADALLLNATDGTAINWSRLLAGLKLSDTPVWFRVNGHAADLVKDLRTFMPYQLKGGIMDDAIPYGFQPASEPALLDLAEAIRQTLDSPQFRTITVSSHLFHNAGATATQELAFTLNALVDRYDFLTEQGLAVDQLVLKTTLSVSVGTSYFDEIAKLRALRVLWQRLLRQYATPSIPAFIHARNSTFYDATTTPYTNLLRATTEAMSAVIGGCDALTIHPYNTVLGQTDAFAQRIAVNISSLLEEETYLNKTIDPAAGSYYLEQLTHRMVETAWALFLKVENMGGLARALEQGFVQQEIDRAYQSRIDAVRNGRPIVGVTKFRFDEPGTPSPETPETNPAGNSVLPDRRLASEFESSPHP